METTTAQAVRMHDRRILLKIKLKSLAEEIRIIRKEEKRPENFSLHNELWAHRMGLRHEAHATHIAYTVIRTSPHHEDLLKPFGHSLRWLQERYPATHGKVDAMVKKYGPKTVVAPEPGKVKSIKTNRKTRAARPRIARQYCDSSGIGEGVHIPVMQDVPPIVLLDR